MERYQVLNKNGKVVKSTNNKVQAESVVKRLERKKATKDGMPFTIFDSKLPEGFLTYFDNLDTEKELIILNLI